MARAEDKASARRLLSEGVAVEIIDGRNKFYNETDLRESHSRRFCPSTLAA
jgi:hypothetical protein